MEQNSIFNTDLNVESSNQILSAAKWSRFIGIVFMIISIIALLTLVIVSFTSANLADSFSAAASKNAQLSFLKETGPIIILIIFVVFIILFAAFSMLFIKMGKHGIDYFSSNEELAFTNMFKNAKTIFLVYAIITVIGLVFSLIGLFL